MTLLRALGISLLLTLVLELLFALVWGKRSRHSLALVALVNLLTNPVVVLAHHLALRFTHLPQLWVVLVLEVAAVAVEALCYRKYGRDFTRPWLFAFLANAFSFGIGLVLNRFIY